MKKKSLVLGFLLLLGTVLADNLRADCIVDEGPYQDDYGYAIFPFYNQCDEDFTITLCVKSLPYGSDRAVFNRYSVFSSGRGEVSITNGKWESFLEYRWDADRLVECPFSD